jgi:hypothetical protein
MIPKENREDQALTPEERWGGIDFSEMVSKHRSKDCIKVYTPEEKVQAATAYFMCGSFKQVQRDIGISWDTVRTWKDSAPWWDEIIHKLRREKQDELDVMMTNYLHEAQHQALDRIKNGDCKLDKNGEVVRVPMSGRDIALTSVAFFDKRALIRGDATSISRRQDPLGDIKDKLEAFAQYNSAKEIDGVPRKKTSIEVTQMIQNGQRRQAEDRGEA